MIAHILTTLLALVLQLSPSVIWKAAVNHTEGDRYQLVVSGEIAKDYYVHPMSDPNVGTLLEVNTTDQVFLAGQPVEEYTPSAQPENKDSETIREYQEDNDLWSRLFNW